MTRRVGSSLTMRMRQDAYKSMLRQDQAWFDRNENAVSALTTALSRDSELVHGALGGRLGTILQSVTALLVRKRRLPLCTHRRDTYGGAHAHTCIQLDTALFEQSKRTYKQIVTARHFLRGSEI